MADVAALAAKAGEALDALPGTPDGIAEFFRAEGIRGYRAESCLCPVANYVKRELGLESDQDVTVSFWETLTVTDEVEFMAWVDGVSRAELDSARAQNIAPGTRRVRPATFAAHRFARLFDNGLYPDLELTGRYEDRTADYPELVL